MTLVDSEGLPMKVVVHSAAIQDRDGAGLVLDKIRRRFPRLELIWADGGYNAWQVEAAIAKTPVLRLAIVKRSDDRKGFVLLPRRWWSSVPSRGSGATGDLPRISRTSPKLSPPCHPRSDPACPPAARQAVSPCRQPVRWRRPWLPASGRFRIGQPTFAGASSNDADAPIADDRPFPGAHATKGRTATEVFGSRPIACIAWWRSAPASREAQLQTTLINTPRPVIHGHRNRRILAPRHYVRGERRAV